MVILGRFWDGLVAFAAIASGMTAEAATSSSSANNFSISTSSSLGPGCYDPWIGDAICDLPNNKAACAYDGGDCCECTCVETTSNNATCGDEGFACVDPEAPCAEDDDVTSITTSEWSTYNTTFAGNCTYSYIGDGFCDSTNNQADCQYDGGDCCSCTCTDAEYTCGGDFGRFACVDPDAPCVDDDDYTSVYNSSSSWSSVNATTGCIDSYIGDGLCDSTNNRADCQYDGGDCCSCTCVDAEYTCGGDLGGFACVDPDAPCVDDDDYTSAYNFSSSSSFTNATTGCIDSYIGDGDCDSTNNRADCQYDGGDCCSCTCVDAEYTCGGDLGGFACVDPDAPCVDDDDYTSAYNFSSSSSFTNATTGCIDSYIGDGDCDSTNNRADCQYDGGDCCSCTCVDESYNCGVSDYNCEDPEAPCVGEDDYMCVLSSSGDGECDEMNNHEECDYDGGDCCESSCKDAEFTCGLNGYNCLDPALGGNSSDSSSSAELNSSAEQHLPTYVLTVFIGVIGALIHALG